MSDTNENEVAVEAPATSTERPSFINPKIFAALDKKKNTSVAIRLHELGPRFRLKLIKIEEGLCRGNVVFHAHQTRTPAEIRKQVDGLKSKKELKEKRKKI